MHFDESKRSLLAIYTLGTHFFLYVFNYISLRNLLVYFYWLMVSIIHLYFYFELRNDQSLNFVNGHASAGLGATIWLLLLFQGLRILSIKIQQKDLVAPSRVKMDLFDERPITIFDVLLFIIYFASMIVLPELVL
jgi:hypothetical protein